MRKISSIFGPQLTTLFTIYIIGVLLTGIYWIFVVNCYAYLGAPGLPNSLPSYHKFDSALSQFISILTVIISTICVIYFILGCTRYLCVRLGRKQRLKIASGKILMLRGGLGISIIVTLFLIIWTISYLSIKTGICA